MRIHRSQRTQYKAPEFFVEESNWHRGIDWYRQQFPVTGAHILAVGEASNAYAKYPRHRGVPERIAAHLPDVRLVYVVRDPIARIRSHYQTKVAEGSEKAPFSDAVFGNPIYLDYSRYAMQIEQYLEHFPREQLLVITSEDLRCFPRGDGADASTNSSGSIRFTRRPISTATSTDEGPRRALPDPARAEEVPEASIPVDPALQGTGEQHASARSGGSLGGAASRTAARGRLRHPGRRAHQDRGRTRRTTSIGFARTWVPDFDGWGIGYVRPRHPVRAAGVDAQPIGAASRRGDTAARRPPDTDRRSSAATSGGVNHAGRSSPCASRRRCSVPEILRACWPGWTSSSGT